MKPISCPCAVAKVTTMADGSFRVYLDLPETALMAAAELMACKRDGVYLGATFLPNEEDPREREDDGDGRNNTKSHF